MGIPAQANFLALIESTEDLIWSVDLDFRLVAFNRAFQKQFTYTFGVPPQQGMKPEDYPLQEHAVVWRPMFERVLSQGAYRTEFVLTDGRALELAFNPIFTEGKITGISIFGKDVTESKAAKASLALLAAVIESSADAIHSVRLDGTVVTWNRGAEQLFGFTAAEALGQCITILAPPGREREVARFMESIAQGNAVDAFDTELRAKNGENIDVSLSLSPIRDSSGAVIGCSGIARDIRKRKQLHRQLEEAEKKYRDIFDGALEGIFQTTLDSRVLSANRAAAEILGYASAEEMIASVHHWEGIWADPSEHANFVAELDRRGAARGHRARLRRKDGTTVTVELNCRRVCGPSGEPLFNEGFFDDITEHQRTEMELRDSEERYRKTFEQAAVGIVHAAFDGQIVRCNSRFAEIVGYPLEEVPGLTVQQLTAPEDLAEGMAVLNQVRDGVAPYVTLEKRYVRKDGRLTWVRLSVAVQWDGGGRPLHFMAIVEDINARKHAEDEIRNLEFYDPLTGLPNRRLLLDRLNQSLNAVDRDHPVKALLFIDLDNFKLLNDTLGHQTGDRLLQQAGWRLNKCVQQPDTVARFGGDEFAVLLTQLTGNAEDAAAQAKTIGEKILSVLSAPYVLAGRECLSACSVGVTIFGHQPGESNEILQQADIAMYQAKAAGRSTVRFFSPSLQAAVNARATMEDDLRYAIRSGQFLVYYQPQMEYGHLVGAEALVRWHHPSRGILGPGTFISLAEETGLILPLGNWVLETVCEQLPAWSKQEDSCAITVAVNISARQLRQPDFVDSVLAALQRTGADPRHLKLELTESMLVDDFEDVAAKMKALKAHGVRFALDDFGTGYSSLSYLKRLPLDQLKIDISFVRDMLSDAPSGSIAQAIVSLGKAMGLSVIAEGVETHEQRIFLARMGCFAFQGYLVSKPVPTEEFERLFPCLKRDSDEIPQ